MQAEYSLQAVSFAEAALWNWDLMTSVLGIPQSGNIAKQSKKKKIGGMKLTRWR